ncbi:spore cortex biosynthesis protein YabQ [Aquibacillus rhizosphaerae]|uniref:Spore cortex biosynthesis protein YabQ n=1 Tax=Aquibacillus rhizosphaerae TaxID=3051431 RepID=A0ABT7L3N1_9BACI|nr:spore cortex biosynthesis protein YabQ [Aquibacillus sp. LR5S19]MDL4840483.1 spore cortex biosynthesis protein YabQ [Aquibacillus sp. LR5S19]
MTLTTQFLTILVMIAGGVYLGAAIETFRRFEVHWKQHKIYAYSIEIGFWLLQTLILFYLLYVVNQGELRFYILLAMLCGYAMYKSVFENIYKRLLERVIKISISIYYFFYRLVHALIVRPIKGLIMFAIAVLLWIWGIVLWIVILLFKIIGYPIKLILVLLWRLIPQKVKKYLSQLAGLFLKIKNIISKWWKKHQK